MHQPDGVRIGELRFLWILWGLTLSIPQLRNSQLPSNSQARNAQNFQGKKGEGKKRREKLVVRLEFAFLTWAFWKFRPLGVTWALWS